MCRFERTWNASTSPPHGVMDETEIRISLVSSVRISKFSGILQGAENSTKFVNLSWRAVDRLSVSVARMQSLHAGKFLSINK